MNWSIYLLGILTAFAITALAVVFDFMVEFILDKVNKRKDKKLKEKKENETI